MADESITINRLSLCQPMLETDRGFGLTNEDDKQLRQMMKIRGMSTVDWLAASEDVAAGREQYYTRSSSNGTLRATLVSIVYIISSAILSIRTYLLRNEAAAFVLAFLVTCSYIVVGVLLPVLSRRVALSKQVQCLAMHRDRYKHCVGSPVRLFTKLEDWVTPACLVLATVEPGIAMLKYVVPKADLEDAFDGSSSMSLVAFASTFFSLFGMLVFGAGILDEFVLDASMIAINGLILEINGRSEEEDEADHDEEKRENVEAESTESVDVKIWIPRRSLSKEEPDAPAKKLDCQKIIKHHRSLHVALADVWRFDCVGGIWFARISIFFMGSLVSASYSLNPKAVIPNCHRVASVMLALGGVALLLRLASITQLCIGKVPGSKAVLAAVGSHADSRPDIAYHVLLTYVNGNPLGITACYLHVTYDLVFKVFSQFAVIVPFVVSVLAHILHPKVQ